MIPLRDNNPSYSFPIITVIFIAMNTVFYFFSGLAGPAEYVKNVFTFGFIPNEFFHHVPVLTVPTELLPKDFPTIEVGNLPTFMTIFTSMFMHGGFMHLLGNVWFLWLFGDNVEDRMGPIKFIFFYLICGIVAALGHALTDTTSTIPMIGASGAISGVLGAYIVLFPYARIQTLVFFFFIASVQIPAFLFLGFWFIGQVYYGFISLGLEGAGVAFFAHVGGFVAGILLVKVFANRQVIQQIRNPREQFFEEDWEHLRNFNKYNDDIDNDYWR